MGFGFRPGGQRPPIKTHVHNYRTLTSFDVWHTHGMAGVTSPTINPGPRHVHSMEGKTTLVNGHVHSYKNITGPAIPTRPGFHIHRYYGTVAIAGRLPHIHRYMGFTSEAPDDNS
ncbi:YmaF family protein [Desulforamulus ferrireducens]|uniref:YmaF family protein n=1 Tax=Desulforamulus ferrireducens TaxID=1833852 RepID=A0A1S6IXQ1_9FIRM|nr:YmaF family protein [Desulforamulus ferrireducens]AQS59536.1 hypothetical protein B0537_10870 [Desulforamulus ferrireducens]